MIKCRCGKEARVRENEFRMYRNNVRILSIQNCVERSKGGPVCPMIAVETDSTLLTRRVEVEEAARLLLLLWMRKDVRARKGQRREGGCCDGYNDVGWSGSSEVESRPSHVFASNLPAIFFASIELNEGPRPRADAPALFVLVDPALGFSRLPRTWSSQWSAEGSATGSRLLSCSVENKRVLQDYFMHLRSPLISSGRKRRPGVLLL